MEIAGMTPDDYLAIVGDLASYWESDRTRHLHHPMFVREFADSAFVAREAQTIVGYLMGFRSQVEPVGYIHLVAVHQNRRGTGIARELYKRFAASVVDHDVAVLRAITTEANTASVAFHRSLGFVPRLVSDYSGRHQDRIVMECPLDHLVA